MIVYMGRVANQRKYQNGCHLRTTSQNHQILDVHTWGTYVPTYTKFEASIFKPVVRKGMHR